MNLWRRSCLESPKNATCARCHHLAAHTQGKGDSRLCLGCGAARPQEMYVGAPTGFTHTHAHTHTHTHTLREYRDTPSSPAIHCQHPVYCQATTGEREVVLPWIGTLRGGRPLGLEVEYPPPPHVLTAGRRPPFGGGGDPGGGVREGLFCSGGGGVMCPHTMYKAPPLLRGKVPQLPEPCAGTSQATTPCTQPNIQVHTQPSVTYRRPRIRTTLQTVEGLVFHAK